MVNSLSVELHCKRDRKTSSECAFLTVSQGVQTIRRAEEKESWAYAFDYTGPQILINKYIHVYIYIGLNIGTIVNINLNIDVKDYRYMPRNITINIRINTHIYLYKRI